MWKKLGVIIGVGALALSLTACGQDDKTATSTDTAKTAEPVQTQSAEPTPMEDEEATSESTDSEVAQFLESYEAFVDEYVAFSEKYKSSDDLVAMANELADMQAKEQQLLAEAEEWENKELSAEDLELYTEVTTRCTKKLATALQNISEGAQKRVG